MADFKFPASVRIRKKNEFERVYREGEKYFHDYFVIFYLKNSCGFSRLGLTVSKKIGNAVKRNRVKRLLREVFRLNRNLLRENFDVVINVRREIVKATFSDIERAFIQFVKEVSL